MLHHTNNELQYPLWYCVMFSPYCTYAGPQNREQSKYLNEIEDDQAIQPREPGSQAGRPQESGLVPGKLRIQWRQYHVTCQQTWNFILSNFRK